MLTLSASVVPQVRSPQYPQSAVRAAQYAAKDHAAQYAVNGTTLSQQHSVTRRITLRYCGVLRILHAVPQISSSVLRHNTAV